MTIQGHQNRSRLRSKMVRLVNEDRTMMTRGVMKGAVSTVVKLNIDYATSGWAKKEEVLIDSLLGLSLQMIEDFDATRLASMQGIGQGLGPKAAQEVERVWWEGIGAERDVWVFFRRDLMKVAQDFEKRLQEDMQRKEEIVMQHVASESHGLVTVRREYYKDVVDHVRKLVAKAVLDSLECQEQRGVIDKGSVAKVSKKMRPNSGKSSIGKKYAGGVYVPTGNPRGRSNKKVIE